MSAQSVSSIIANQNDAFRSSAQHAKHLVGQRVHTHGIEALGLEIVLDIWSHVRRFETFTADNDPHAEHDFGSFKHPVAGNVFWKIDYYDRSFKFGSENPADPAVTARVLTVMLAEEY
ncbi:MAG TPA: DUF3768 domain-containing protein [Hyphomonadaceae bacterium]|nr:DUF3768 domain-containing protein [Hyphomonadaceae bacterium]